jgi:hypothetical protein
MRPLIPATAGLGAFLLLGASPGALHPAAPGPTPTDSTSTLSSDLRGTWKGTAKDAGSSRTDQVTITWKPGADGHLKGTVQMQNEARYPITVVWTSDTAVIYESAPHQSKTLHERVVTRTIVRKDGNALVGHYEARPTMFKGKTLKGEYTVKQASS